MKQLKRILSFDFVKYSFSIHLRTWETLRTTFILPTAQELVKKAVLPAVKLSIDRSVDEVSGVLLRPEASLFTDFTSETFFAQDLPVTEHVALRALETV